MKEIGHEKEMAGLIEQGVAIAAHGSKLEQRVEPHELDAGRLVDG